MRYLSAIVAAFALLQAPAPAFAQSRYEYAITCSVYGDFLANFVRSNFQFRARPGLAQGFQNDAERWLLVAISTGQADANQARYARSTRVSDMMQRYYQNASGDGRKAYANGIIDAFERCQKNPPR